MSEPWHCAGEKDSILLGELTPENSISFPYIDSHGKVHYKCYHVLFLNAWMQSKMIFPDTRQPIYPAQQQQIYETVARM